jgi:thioredoxin-dependent peroxiredoxin
MNAAMSLVGKKAPAFKLPSSDGTDVSLPELAGKYVVLYFYPKDDTPGCTVEAQEFRDDAAKFKKLGAVVLGVSRDTTASHCKFRDKYELNFPLLTDKDAQVMEKYGAWGEKVLYGKKTTGVIRSTALIDKAGKVVAHWPKVKAKGHSAEVLAKLKEVIAAEKSA